MTTRCSITQLLQQQQHLWLIDWQVGAVGTEMLWDLGLWLRCQLKKGVHEQGDAAQKVLNSCGISVDDLRSQWSDQHAAQLSI
ncbi:hypothetical protein JVU11DRAFT_8090 [Chiua virens]|nr:hypothetical protein JVU11DRAFT_8090 [Chiua virens]